MCNVGHSKHETCYVITVTVGPGGSRLRLPSQVPTSHSDERETDDRVKLLSQSDLVAEFWRLLTAAWSTRAHLCHDRLRVTAGRK